VGVVTPAPLSGVLQTGERKLLEPLLIRDSSYTRLLTKFSGELPHLLPVYKNNIITCYFNDVTLCFEL